MHYKADQRFSSLGRKSTLLELPDWLGGSYLRSRVKPLGVQIDDWFRMVVEPDAVSGTQHNLQNRSKSRFVSAGCLFVDDNTRADVEFSMSFSFFMLFLRYNFTPHLGEASPTVPPAINHYTPEGPHHVARQR